VYYIFAHLPTKPYQKRARVIWLRTWTVYQNRDETL
jgi:hypothetical protein